MTTPNAGEDVEQQELSFIAGGNQNGTATLEDDLVGVFFCFFLFNKTKHTKKRKQNLSILFPHDSATTLFSIYLKELKLVSTEKSAHRCL